MDKIKLYNKISIPYKGKELTADELLSLPEAAKGLSKKLLFSRLKKLDVEEALTRPVRTRVVSKVGYTVRYDGKSYRSMKDACDELGIDYSYFYYVLNKNNYDINKTIQKCLNRKKIPKYPYKGKEYTISELARHPDNIHCLARNSIKCRLRGNLYSEENLLSEPLGKMLRRTKMVYGGVEYKSLSELCRRNGIVEYYENLVAQTSHESRVAYLDRLLGHVNVKESK